MRLPQFDGFTTVARLCYHRHIILTTDCRRQALQNEGMIIGY
jgi:hypothetical protein